jgi:hypothetical protein
MKNKKDFFVSYDNFLDKKLISKLKHETIERDTFPFYFQKTVATTKETNGDFYFVHTVYNNNKPNSPLLDLFEPILKKLNVKSLIRIKINLYPRTEKIHYHASHADYDFKHKGCLLSLNTCNGFTIIGKEKIPSIENQALLFDPSIKHNSTTCTNRQARFNINFNYF